MIVDSTCHIPTQERQHLNSLLKQSYGLLTMADYDPLCDDVKMSNVIGLFMIMKEIREQKPLDDLDALGIDEKGKPYY